MKRALIPAAVAVILAACSSSNGSGGKDTITLYNGQHEQTTSQVVSAFEKATGINVKVRSGDEDDLASQISQEGSRSPADVFYTENTPALVALDTRGLLAPIDATTLAGIPANDSAKNGNWVGVSARVNVLVYNTDALQPSQLPTSIMDLADPKWKGKLGIAPGETDFQPIVESIARAHGQGAALAWLKGLKANAGDRNYPDNETLVSDINQGHAQIGVMNHYYWYRLQEEVGKGAIHSAIATFAPQDPGYLIDVSGAAVLKSSSHLAEAQRFVAFLVGTQGESILAKSFSYEYPLAAGVAANAVLPPFSGLHPIDLPVADIGDGSEAVALLQQAQLA